jgi:hypothetical protein
MPTISMFFGILISMFTGTREHRPPHIHADYGEFSASFDILTAERIEGSLPPRQSRMVMAWIEIHREELLANWTLVERRGVLFKIDPLK